MDLLDGNTVYAILPYVRIKYNLLLINYTYMFVFWGFLFLFFDKYLKLVIMKST